ncbi:MAG: DEAD/DEAH box helicase [Clostridia bacterium]|nr:DEAD/DEAH box helicase [Clostridia bacterium]
MVSDNNEIRERENHRVFKQLLTTFLPQEETNSKQENEAHLDTDIQIIPKVFYNEFKKQLKVEFRIGNKQFYKIKNLTDFYDKMLNHEVYQYGAKLNLLHEEASFTEQTKPILAFLLKYAEIMKYTDEATGDYTYYGKNLSLDTIILSNTGLDDFFDAVSHKEIAFQKGNIEKTVQFIEQEPDIQFQITQESEEQFSINTNIDIFSYDVLQGKNHLYILFQNKLYRCSKEYENTVLKILDVFRKNYTSSISFHQAELTNLFAIIAPKMKDKLVLTNLSQEVTEKCIPKKLGVKIYLDYEENGYITAQIKFCYGDTEFNPLENENIHIPRNQVEENQALTQFIQTGFMLDRGNHRLILAKDEQIYRFLSEEIEDYMKKYEVLATDSFKKKEIKSFHMKEVSVKIENNLLSIDLSKIGIDLSDLAEMMQKYSLKKKFHRLKDGSYIKLENNETFAFLDHLSEEIEIDYTKLKGGILELPAYRTLYLDTLLKELNHVKVKKNEEYKEMIQNIENTLIVANTLPENLNATMRNYQITGYEWLKQLENYHFGGILADDMGLGKTLQVLAVILDYVNLQKGTPSKRRLEVNQAEKKVKPSFVVCPSSLTLNWLNEAKKFTPDLRALVISGSSIDRAKKIKQIEQYHLIITSYDSLKRDIEFYEECHYQFKYMIADEAQYIKNNHTQNAKVIKQIEAETRYALTGTPIENSLSELWSIFDFIMPGYLFRYRKFKEMYEIPIVKENSDVAMQKLKKMIEPFTLRRIKKEVLTELPDKTVTILQNEMQEEQQKLYLSYLARAKKEVAEEIEVNGFQNSQMKILALLMRLRQICCHPSLFIEDYEGESSKLNQCMQVLEDAVNSGHKILLFSGYTSMFEMIEKELKAKNISYLKLTGQTKVSDRIELVDKFNEDKGIKVFLISLKAGGTGLNLTGADVVIHYDPWWNLSAENQATDRTYRIGQKNNVQVYKLITKNSIEEKIYELQQKKAKLADNMLSTQNTFISQLSKEDIMELFG